jgi:hypothetical protein
MSSLVLFVRYNGASMTLRYEYSVPNTTSSFDLNGSALFFKAQTTIGVLVE